MIGGITPEGKLYTMTLERAFKGEDCIQFLECLQQQIPGKLRIIWDGASIHRSKAIKKYLADGAAQRLRLVQLPGYAPELNPQEGIWRYLKYIELKNVCCRDIEHLKAELRKARERLRHKKHIFRACFEHAGYL